MKTVNSALACSAIIAVAVVASMQSDASAAARKSARSSCEAAAAMKLIGQAPPEDAQVRQLTGASKVRRVKPGQAVTMDYSPERVTLELANGRIVSTSCG